MGKVLYLTILIFLFSVEILFSGQFSGLKNVIKYEKAKGKLFDHLYPVGFSEKGFFSYIRIPADEAIGCYLWKYCVKNLDSNKIVYSVGFKYDDCEMIKSIKDLTNNYETQFAKKNYLYGIRTSFPKLKKFPMEKDGDIIDCRLKRIKTVKRSNCLYKTVYFLMVYSKINGSKIAALVIEKDLEGLPHSYNSFVNGYIESPFEERIVIVVEQEHRGWKGPPNISTFMIIGTTLINGFK